MTDKMERKTPDRKYRVWRNAFAVLALVLSHTMVGVVAYEYSDMVCGGLHKYYSAPPEVAFLLGIPFGAGVLICIVLALWFHGKYHTTTSHSEKSF